jgi:hypothetical protein
MKKTIALCAAPLFAAWAGNAYAEGWHEVTSTETTTIYIGSDEIGKSGKFRECASQEVTITTTKFVKDTGSGTKERGITQTVSPLSDPLPVEDTSLCNT